MDLVVFMDDNTEAVKESSTLSILARIIYEFEFTKILKQPPLLLKGGYSAWKAYLDAKHIPKTEWVQTGVRKKSFNSTDPPPMIDGGDIKRTSYDYVSSFFL